MVILFFLNVHTTFKIIICKVIIFFWLSVILYNRHLIYLINHKLMLLVCSVLMIQSQTFEVFLLQCTCALTVTFLRIQPYKIPDLCLITVAFYILDLVYLVLLRMQYSFFTDTSKMLLLVLQHSNRIKLFSIILLHILNNSYMAPSNEFDRNSVIVQH